MRMLETEEVGGHTKFCITIEKYELRYFSEFEIKPYIHMPYVSTVHPSDRFNKLIIESYIRHLYLTQKTILIQIKVSMQCNSLKTQFNYPTTAILETYRWK